jgi:hypothetical protein
MKFRSIVATLFVIALMLTPLAIHAQDDIDTCLGLSEADCAYINDAYANSDYNSFFQEFTIDFSITGVPDLPIEFSLQGSGPFAFDMASEFPIEMEAVMNVDFDIVGETGTGTVEFRAVDGNLYLFNEVDGWIGFNALEAAELGFDQAGGLGLPVDPSTLLPAEGEDMGDLGDLGDLEALGIAEDDVTAGMEILGALLEVPGFLSYTRNGDDFNFNADITSLLSATEFTDALELVGELAGDPTVSSLGMLAPMFLDSGTITVNQYVNPETQSVDGIDFVVDATVPGSLLDPEFTEPLVIALVFTVRVSDINAEFDFTAPEGVELTPMS